MCGEVSRLGWGWTLCGQRPADCGRMSTSFPNFFFSLFQVNAGEMDKKRDEIESENSVTKNDK